MKNHSLIFFLIFMPMYLFSTIFLIVNTSWSIDKPYPIKINAIDKDQADYKTPENTLAAGFSALMHNDLDWYYETLTKSAAKKEKATFEKTGIDINEIYNLINPGDQLIILDKKAYKNGILIYSKGITTKGTICTGANVFVVENGLWKETLDYTAEEDIHMYFDVAPSEQIVSTEIRLFPNHWNYQWYQHMLDKKTNQGALDIKKVSVLCAIGNLTDTDGNIRNVEEIDPETLVLNYVVKPLPWNKGQKKGSIALIKSEKPGPLPHPLVEKWENHHQLHRTFKGSFMLIKFDKLEAIGSLSPFDEKKTYMVTISGKLKDNETHFRGETQINIISAGFQEKHNFIPSNPAVENHNRDNWWDQME